MESLLVEELEDIVRQRDELYQLSLLLLFKSPSSLPSILDLPRHLRIDIMHLRCVINPRRLRCCDRFVPRHYHGNENTLPGHSISAS